MVESLRFAVVVGVGGGRADGLGGAAAAAGRLAVVEPGEAAGLAEREGGSSMVNSGLVVWLPVALGLQLVEQLPKWHLKMPA